MSDTQYKGLSDALWFAYHEDPSLAEELVEVRSRKPILNMLTDEQIKEFVKGIHDNLVDQIDDCALEFIEGQQNLHQCRNPRCEVSSMPLDALKAPFPDPRLIETISPGDTVPQGLCPACGSPVYQVEMVHPDDRGEIVDSQDTSQDNTGSIAEGSMDCTGDCEVRYLADKPFGIKG